jgi:hypothetical protein
MPQTEKETFRCRRELLQRLREERAAIELSVVIDDETVFGGELVNDEEVATAVVSDDATSTEPASVEPADDYVTLMPPMITDDECEFMSSLPEPDDVASDCVLTCEEILESEEEEEFFDTLRDWVWGGSMSQYVWTAGRSPDGGGDCSIVGC